MLTVRKSIFGVLQSSFCFVNLLWNHFSSIFLFFICIICIFQFCFELTKFFFVINLNIRSSPESPDHLVISLWSFLADYSPFLTYAQSIFLSIFLYENEIPYFTSKTFFIVIHPKATCPYSHKI